jgi:hypothetical protein
VVKQSDGVNTLALDEDEQEVESAQRKELPE